MPLKEKFYGLVSAAASGIIFAGSRDAAAADESGYLLKLDWAAGVVAAYLAVHFAFRSARNETILDGGSGSNPAYVTDPAFGKRLSQLEKETSQNSAAVRRVEADVASLFEGSRSSSERAEALRRELELRTSPRVVEAAVGNVLDAYGLPGLPERIEKLSAEIDRRDAANSEQLRELEQDVKDLRTELGAVEEDVNALKSRMDLANGERKHAVALIGQTVELLEKRSPPAPTTPPVAATLPPSRLPSQLPSQPAGVYEPPKPPIAAPESKKTVSETLADLERRLKALRERRNGNGNGNGNGNDNR